MTTPYVPPAPTELPQPSPQGRVGNRYLPFAWAWPLVAGVIAGLALRLTFAGQPEHAYSAMTASFIYLSPLVVGAVTVYVAELRARRGVAYYFGAPFADSFPPRALDDHVRIGGTYFDRIDTSYTLVPRGDSIALTIRMRYRVTTSFNWYAKPIAQWLIGDFEETILQFYRRRSETTRPS